MACYCHAFGAGIIEGGVLLIIVKQMPPPGFRPAIHAWGEHPIPWQSRGD